MAQFLKKVLTGKGENPVKLEEARIRDRVIARKEKEKQNARG
jgi:hypothetical protein